VKHVIYMIVVSALMFACGKKNEGEPAAAPTPPAEPAGSAAAAVDPAQPGAGSADPAAVAEAPPAEEELDVPTEVDFEELAGAEITDKNMAARFAELEKELAE
jgi:hypothetical protein